MQAALWRFGHTPPDPAPMSAGATLSSWRPGAGTPPSEALCERRRSGAAAAKRWRPHDVTAALRRHLLSKSWLIALSLHRRSRGRFTGRSPSQPRTRGDNCGRARQNPPGWGPHGKERKGEGAARDVATKRLVPERLQRGLVRQAPRKPLHRQNRTQTGIEEGNARVTGRLHRGLRSGNRRVLIRMVCPRLPKESCPNHGPALRHGQA